MVLAITGSIGAQDIQISEIMQNPSAVSDATGEWFELYNPTGVAIDIDGWTIDDDGTNAHVIANGGALNVPAGGRLVLCNSSDFGTNGGVNCKYQYATFTLGNATDEVVLTDTILAERDRVNYDGGPGYPDPAGA